MKKTSIRAAVLERIVPSVLMFSMILTSFGNIAVANDEVPVTPVSAPVEQTITVVEEPTETPAVVEDEDEATEAPAVEASIETPALIEDDIESNPETPAVKDEANSGTGPTHDAGLAVQQIGGGDAWYINIWPTDLRFPSLNDFPDFSEEDIVESEATLAPAFFFDRPDIVIEKKVVGGAALPSTFSVSVMSLTLSGFDIEEYTFDANGDIFIENPGIGFYSIYENNPAAQGYEASYSGCSAFLVSLFGDDHDCTITNTPVAPVIPACVGGDTTFDTFALGTVNGQGGWQVTGGYDQEVVDNTYGFSTFGCKSLRISNAVTSGSFSDQTFSYETANEAGEAGDNHFEAQFDIATTKPTAQTGLAMTVSPDDGNGGRMSFLRFVDQADGIHVFFVDVSNPGPLPTGSSFPQTEIATLDRSVPHTIKFSMDFVPGPGNDVVEIYIDGVLKHTGTSWENYYRYDPEQSGNGNIVPVTDQLLFRSSSTAAPANDGEGFLFDNMSLSTSNEEPQACLLVSDKVNTYSGFVPASEVVPHPNWTTAYNADGAKWVWDTSDTDGVVVFTRTFTSTNAGTANIGIAADNGYTAKLNGTALSCDGSGNSNFGNPVDTCSAPVVAGTNTLEFTVNNEGGVATPPDNPAGLYYKVTIVGSSCTEVAPVPTSDVTLCKVSDAEGNPGLSGWQLYLKGSNVQSGLSVPSTNSTGVSSNPLVAGMQYLLNATGTWTNQGSANPVDAEYSTTDAWSTQMDGYNGYGVGILELEVNEADTNWGPYNASHAYSQIFTPGVSGPVNFRIFDGDTTSHVQNEGWFGDNSGNLTVGIDNAYAGTTTEGGCVTLQDVPYGTYAIGEIAQEDWSLVEVIGDEGSEVDDGSVEVNSATERFTLVNHYDDPTPSACVISSDTTTIEGGEPSFIATFIHSSWTAIIEGAQWIWGDEAIVNPVGTETQTFTKTFTLDSVPGTGGSLEIAADNTYSVSMNGVVIGSSLDEDNYTVAGQDIIPVPAANLIDGNNTLEITVTNLPMSGGTTQTNPAGLKYKLTIAGTDCTETPAPTESIKVHIFKYLMEDGVASQVQNDSGLPLFPMKATYAIAGVGTNLSPGDDYQLGNAGGGVWGSDGDLLYAANTRPLSVGDTYGTYEVTGGSSPVVATAGECSVGKYLLRGYKTGDTLAQAQAAEITSTSPNYVGITSKKYVIVVNEDCADVLDNEPNPEPPTQTATTTVVRPTNMQGWAFFKENNVVGNQTGQMVTGPATAPAGTGSAEFVLTASNEGMALGTVQFAGTRLDKIVALTYSTYRTDLSAGTPALPALQFEFDDDVTDANDLFKGRMVYEPYHNNPPLNASAWQEWDTKGTNGGNGSGNWWFSSNPNFPAGQVTCPQSNPCTYAEIIAAYPNAGIRNPINSVTGGTLFKAGSGSAFTSHVDRFVIGVESGSNVTTTTFDFESDLATESDDDDEVGEADEIQTSGGGSSRSGGRRTSSDNGDGQVLGASTENDDSIGGQVLGDSCPLITDYMREGMANDTGQVTLLQNFLNGEVGSILPTTGFFGSLTTAAVNTFQLKYADEVLAPWGITAPTGYVYKTTAWKINDIACPDLEVAVPQVP